MLSRMSQISALFSVVRACFRLRRLALPARCLHHPLLLCSHPAASVHLPVTIVSRGELTDFFFVLACTLPLAPTQSPPDTHNRRTRPTAQGRQEQEKESVVTACSYNLAVAELAGMAKTSVTVLPGLEGVNGNVILSSSIRAPCGASALRGVTTNGSGGACLLQVMLWLNACCFAGDPVARFEAPQKRRRARVYPQERGAG